MEHATLTLTLVTDLCCSKVSLNEAKNSRRSMCRGTTSRVSMSAPGNQTLLNLSHGHQVTRDRTFPMYTQPIRAKGKYLTSNLLGLLLRFTLYKGHKCSSNRLQVTKSSTGYLRQTCYLTFSMLTLTTQAFTSSLSFPRTKSLWRHRGNYTSGGRSLLLCSHLCSWPSGVSNTPCFCIASLSKLVSFSS